MGLATTVLDLAGIALIGKDTQPLVTGTLLERLRDEMRFLHNALGLDATLESEPEDPNLPRDIETEV